jgi:ribosome-associated heat shock protein Hsp15
VKGLRLDKFLCFARFTKTRSLAQRAIADGHIRINGERIFNAHHAIQPGQSITLTLNERLRVVRVETLPIRRGPPAEAQSCYSELHSSQVIDAKPDRL